MHYQDTRLPGAKLDKNRIETWRWPSATAAIPHDDLDEFAEVQNPNFGDLALCRVKSLGANTFVENRFGCNMQIFEGTIILGVFANRYATEEYEGIVPKSISRGESIALLNRGGTIGKVISKNSSHSDPTQLEVLAYVRNKSGQIANTTLYGKEASGEPIYSPKSDRKLVLIVGSSMDAGKSHAGKAVVYSLSVNGKKVVAGKATGVAARRDPLLMKAAGAIYVTDFIDFGLPSSYLLDENKTLELFWKVYNTLYEQAGPGGYIVIELADGILQRETSMILSNEEVKKRVDNLVFACGDPLSAVAGIEVIKSKYGLETTAISGRAANSILGLREVSHVLGSIPTFNAMQMDVNKIASLFA